MNGLGWLLAYMVVGIVWSLYECDEEDTPGVVFLALFCWPLPAAFFVVVELSRCIVQVVDRLFELLETGDEE